MVERVLEKFLLEKQLCVYIHIYFHESKLCLINAICKKDFFLLNSLKLHLEKTRSGAITSVDK